MADNFQDPEQLLKISLKAMREELSILKRPYRDARAVKTVIIDGYDEPCHEEFEKFLSHYSHLETLSMEGSALISDDHLKIIGRKLKKLQSVAIPMNTSITDAGLGFLSGENDLSEEVSCPLLNSIDIGRAGDITDKGIRSTTSRLPKLEHFGLWVNKVDKNVAQCIAETKGLKSVTLRKQDTFSRGEHKLMELAGFEIEQDSVYGDGVEEHWIRKAKTILISD